MLGSDYVVHNFGAGGKATMRSSNKPYWNSEQYQKALKSNPDVVIIGLGTNDA